MDNFYLIDTNNILKSIDANLSNLLEMESCLESIADRLNELVSAVNDLTDKLGDK